LPPRTSDSSREFESKNCWATSAGGPLARSFSVSCTRTPHATTEAQAAYSNARDTFTRFTMAKEGADCSGNLGNAYQVTVRYAAGCMMNLGSVDEAT
jgi:hypothetical protein